MYFLDPPRGLGKSEELSSKPINPLDPSRVLGRLLLSNPPDLLAGPCPLEGVDLEPQVPRPLGGSRM